MACRLTSNGAARFGTLWVALAIGVVVGSSELLCSGIKAACVVIGDAWPGTDVNASKDEETPSILDRFEVDVYATRMRACIIEMSVCSFCDVTLL